MGEALGYPMFMKPYDGGAWAGVSRIDSESHLRTAYEQSGTRVMHLQKAVSAAGALRTLGPHFLPNLGDGEQLRRLRERFVLLAMGEGPWEKPEESWRLADVLGSKGIPNRVDSWGPGWDHDWPTWRAMLPKYLDELT